MFKIGDKVSIHLRTHVGPHRYDYLPYKGEVVAVSAKTYSVKLDNGGRIYRRSHDAVSG